MTITLNADYAAPWHRASYERFINVALPQAVSAIASATAKSAASGRAG